MKKYILIYYDYNNNKCIAHLRAKNNIDLRHKIINHYDMSLIEKPTTKILLTN
jgi:hypothetical protein